MFKLFKDIKYKKTRIKKKYSDDMYGDFNISDLKYHPKMIELKTVKLVILN